MHIARVRHEGPDGAQVRVVVSATPQPGGRVDVRSAARLRLERAGPPARAARRIADDVVVPDGPAAALEPGRSLSAGDDIEFEIERRGALRNRIGMPASSGSAPARRERREARADADAPGGLSVGEATVVEN
jgi:hypothetical protein